MDDHLFEEFLDESWEMITHLDEEVHRLESDPLNERILNDLFHSIHTVKGSCRFIGLSQIGSVSSSTEKLLDQMRQKKVAVTPETLSPVIEGITMIKDLMEGLEATNEEPKLEVEDLIIQLETLSESATDAESIAGDESGCTEPFSKDLSSVTVEKPEGLIIDLACDSETEINPSEIQETKSCNKESKIHELVDDLGETRDHFLKITQTDEDTRYQEPVSQLDFITNELQKAVQGDVCDRDEKNNSDLNGFVTGFVNQEDLIPLKPEPVEQPERVFDEVEAEEALLSVSSPELTDHRVLVLDESLFFRNLVATAVESAGGFVDTVSKIEELKQLLDEEEVYQAVIADLATIGEELSSWVEEIRSRKGYETVSLISLSGTPGSKDECASWDAGFDRHLVKLNARHLNQSIHELSENKEIAGKPFTPCVE